MADFGDIQTIIGTFPINLRPQMTEFAKAILKMRFGHPSTDTVDKLVNFSGGFLSGTTPNTPGDVMALPHGIDGKVPYLGIGALRLDAVGSSIVPLTVSRVADNKRIYLTSTIADAPFTLVVEG